MSRSILETELRRLSAGEDIPTEKIEPFFGALITESDESLIADVLNAWNGKGTAEEELFEIASLMRSRMKRVNSRHETFVDIVGTGGSRSKTFNVSTAAAFVIAGSGLPVAKHGNRSATSNSGSADALSSLGIGLELGPLEAERHLNELGICFMFAPRFHSLSAHLANARRSIGGPTIFNNLGPLCNPASAPHQVIGVWSKELIEPTAKALARLGTERSWVVNGENGLDEIALVGTTHVAEIRKSKVSMFSITASDFEPGEATGELPLNCTTQESSTLIAKIFDNKCEGKSAEKLVLINAAAAIFVAGRANDLPEAFKMAETSIRSGNAREKLSTLRLGTTK